MQDAVLVSQIDALLPQTQCRKCGHPGCRPYAQSIAQGEAINKCLPGGVPTVLALAKLLARPVLPLVKPAIAPQRAVIREAECIGCTKCRQVCPTDAIVGAAKRLHTVIANECTGCELCLAPCPVDCIEMQRLSEAEGRIQRARADYFRSRYHAQQQRLREPPPVQAASTQAVAPTETQQPPAVQAALARLKAQRPPISKQQKRQQAETNMAQAALRRAERQLAQCTTPQLQAQVEQLRARLTSAKQALHPTPETPSIDLNQARIATALARIQLNKAEKTFGEHPTAEQHIQLNELRQALEQAQQQLQQTAPAPSPTEIALAQAKQHYVAQRNRLRAAKQHATDDLIAAGAAFQQAEQTLQAAEAACERPLPARQLIDKHPQPTKLRELKTELAYARAELSRQQRQSPANPSALQHAQARLAQAEQRLQHYTDPPAH